MSYPRLLTGWYLYARQNRNLEDAVYFRREEWPDNPVQADRAEAEERAFWRRKGWDPQRSVNTRGVTIGWVRR